MTRSKLSFKRIYLIYLGVLAALVIAAVAYVYFLLREYEASQPEQQVWLAVEELSAGKKTAAFVVHGGTVMAVMERFAFPQNGFYVWQVKNGCGFAAELDLAAWQSGCRKLTDIRSIP